jgi:DNA polymerase-3 subunit alpha
MNKYVPLHVHTSRNSIGDSILKLNSYIDKAKELGLDTLCITGHGSLADMYDFYFKCIENKIKPIIGCEIYLTPDMENKTKDSKTYHMILIAKDNIGLKNLINIVSVASLQGFYKKPRVDLNYIREYSEGIICTTACVGGMLPQYILDNQEELIESHINELKDIFGANLYFEIQPGDFADQITVNNKLIELSNKHNVPLVLTNDIHYLNEEDYIVHDYHVRLGQKKTASEDGSLIYPDKCYWLMPYDRLIESMSLYDKTIVDEAINNTIKIGQECNVSVEVKDLNLPEFECPDNYTPRQYIEHLCYERLDEIQYLITDPNRYIDRMHFELDTLEELGFTSYMLIMWDIYRYTREQGIMMGPGRGSVSGSVVAYLLQLVTIDPLKYNLLFERFTSVHRKGSIPDIDMDCPSQYREQLFKYVIDKYGIDHCAAVSTFTMRKAKSAIRDVCRLLEIDLKTADIIAKLIPTVYYLDDDSEEDKLVDLSIAEALEHVPELRDYQKIYPEMFDIAMKLEGLESSASIHAAGTLITNDPVIESMPMIRQDKELQATSLELKACESVKGIKYDFLGLNTLDILIYCEQLTGVKFDMEFYPCDDPEIWELISSNKTTGLFQIGTDTYKKRMPRLAPKTIQELAACLALVRGPCISAGTDEVYMRIQEGLDSVHLIHPYYDDATKDTNGALIFQEQLMQVCINMGMSIEESFKTMKFAAKKKFDKLKEAKDSLYENVKDTISDEAFESIFKIIVDAGKYLFNQSHAVAYAMVGYTTAFYKCHYPKEFIASTLSHIYINGGDAKKRKDKLQEIFKDARRLGINFLPPDIRKSSWKFTIEGDSIRVGLCAIASFSEAAYNEIVEKCIPFDEDIDPLEQIMDKVEKKKCGKRAMIPLILSGALGDRCECYNTFCTIRKEEPQSELFIHNKLTIDLYGEDREVEAALLEIPYTTYPANGLQAIGIEDKPNYKPFEITAYVTRVKQHKTKTKEQMAFLTFDTGDGEIELTAFADVYKPNKKLLKKDTVVKATIKKTNKGIILMSVAN